MENTKNILNTLPNFHGIIYDFDGTIATIDVDWNALKKDLQEYVFKLTGNTHVFTPLDWELIRCRWIYGQSLYEELLNIISFHELKNGLKEKNHLLIDYIKSSQQKQALFTMNTTHAIEKYLNEIFKDNPFDIVVTKNTCIKPKPSADDLQMICKQWGLSWNNVVYLGNSKLDAESWKMAWLITYII